MPHTKEVFDAMNAKASWFKEMAGQPSSMLYVGWRSGSHPWWHRKFCPDLGVTRVGVIEIFQKNFDDLAKFVKDGLLSEVKEYELIHSDVKEIKKHVPKDRYDIVFWDHGPEHVSWEDLQEITKSIMEVTGRLVLYCCPWGKWPQKATDGNADEEHKFDVLPEHFTQLGLNVVTFGGCNQENKGELVGFRFVGEYEGKNTP